MWLWAMTEAVCSSLSAHTLQQLLINQRYLGKDTAWYQLGRGREHWLEY